MNIIDEFYTLAKIKLGISSAIAQFTNDRIDLVFPVWLHNSPRNGSTLSP